MTQVDEARREPAARARAAQDGYSGSRFAEVWSAICEQPYETLPYGRVTARSIPTLVRQNVYRAARRTLRTRADLLEPFDKLVHPLGICLRGSWRITEASEFTGYFRKGRRGLLIARASDALGEFRAGKLRLLGLAGKLYPTDDPEHLEPLETANFFMLENLGGSHTRHFVDARQATDLIPMVPHPSLAWKLPVGAIAGAAFALADRALSPTQPMVRQLYPVAELGEQGQVQTRSPAVMRLVGSDENRRIDRADLREELDMAHHPNGIRFHIEVAARRSYLWPRGFQRIGELHFTQSVASWAGDHRLHFAHAPYRHAASARTSWRSHTNTSAMRTSNGA